MKGLVLVFLLIASIGYADNVSAEYAFEVGYLPVDMFRDVDSSYWEEALSFYTDLEAKITILDLLFFGGGMRCHFVNHDSFESFKPYTMDFRFEVGLKIGGFSAGFRHNCYHPVTPNGMQLSTIDSGFEEIYIRFEGKIGIF